VCSGNNAAGNSSPAKNEAATAAAVEQVPEGGGQVGAPGRPKMDLIAVAATDGTTPGCTEAFTVITEYYQQLPQAEGPGERVLDVQGKVDVRSSDGLRGRQPGRGGLWRAHQLPAGGDQALSRLR
jgi:hypothetical protein